MTNVKIASELVKIAKMLMALDGMEQAKDNGLTLFLPNLGEKVKHVFRSGFFKPLVGNTVYDGFALIPKNGGIEVVMKFNNGEPFVKNEIREFISWHKDGSEVDLTEIISVIENSYKRNKDKIGKWWKELYEEISRWPDNS